MKKGYASYESYVASRNRYNQKRGYKNYQPEYRRFIRIDQQDIKTGETKSWNNVLACSIDCGVCYETILRRIKNGTLIDGRYKFVGVK